MLEIEKRKFLKNFKERPMQNKGIWYDKRDLSDLIQKSFLIIDKDVGPSSHSIAENLKTLLNKYGFDVKKTGHSGTLDPKVTGILVCGINDATRLMEYMLKSDKQYVCMMYLHKEVSKEIVENMCKKFIGKIKQLPPIISAVKRQERIREIYDIKILDFDFESKKYLLYNVSCQHGTYIRKLCTDMGESIGVNSQMAELRRVKAGPFDEKNYPIISLDKLRNLLELYSERKKEIRDEKLLNEYEIELRKYLLPYEILLKEFKIIYLRNSAINSISHGADLGIPGVSKIEENIEIGDEVILMSLKNELVAIGTSLINSENTIKKSKGIVVKLNKVFMDTKTYPRLDDNRREYEEHEENE